MPQKHDENKRTTWQAPQKCAGEEKKCEVKKGSVKILTRHE